jgi:dipeptidyl aminopeptidase/acylaminoacyl peptidase
MDTSFAHSLHPTELICLYLDGSNQINLTETPRVSESYPAFSPDGSQMCFFRGNSIYVMGIDGSNPTLLVDGDSQEISDPGIPKEGCDWSPDGKKIAFHAVIPGPAEGDLRKALKRATAEGDSKKILEKQSKLLAELDEEVYVINADGTDRTALTDNSASDLNGDWSPDGTKITFVSNRDGGFDFNMYTMDADGSDVVQVTTESVQGEDDPDWQPLPGTTPPKAAGGSDVDQVTKKPGVDDVDRDRPERTVIVKPGDSLWSISEQRLGPEASPQQVYDHTIKMYALNRNLIGSDPDLIFAGQRLSLPPRYVTH